MTRLRDGDRFWYERVPEMFTADELAEIYATVSLYVKLFTFLMISCSNCSHKCGIQTLLDIIERNTNITFPTQSVTGKHEPSEAFYLRSRYIDEYGKPRSANRLLE